jgi:cytochrome c553
MSTKPSLVLFSLAVAGTLAAIVPVAYAGGNAAAGQTKAAACAGCHGMDGNGGADASWPKLAGQDADYIAKQLKDFKSGARKDPIMAGMSAGLSEQDMQDIGAYFASLKTKPGVAKDAKLAKLGERLYRGGNAKTGVSACMSCHGPSGHGIPPRFPKVSGQTTVYTGKQMKAFKDAVRTNDGEIMTRIAFRMSEQEIRAVSEYMAGLH